MALFPFYSVLKKSSRPFFEATFSPNRTPAINDVITSTTGVSAPGATTVNPVEKSPFTPTNSYVTSATPPSPSSPITTLSVADNTSSIETDTEQSCDNSLARTIVAESQALNSAASSVISSRQLDEPSRRENLSETEVLHFHVTVNYTF